MVKLLTYFSISTLLAVVSIYYSYAIHEQFYPTIVYLTNNKLCILSLGNFGFCFALSLANVMIKIFFNEMADDETNEILQRSKYSITEICIALTSFRHELTKTVIVLFVALLFIKSFHWLSILRMENFQRGTQQNLQNNVNQRYIKCRLFFILLFLLLVDVACSAILCYLLYQQQRFSVIVLFAFEFAILSASMFTQIGKFIILLIDYSYGGSGWPYKPTVMFVIEFFHDLLHLALYSIFIWILTINWGFPLHLLRELFLAFHTLRTRIIHFYHYNKIIKVLDTQFTTITRDQLLATQRDVVCVICFAEMETGKELPCKHVFHLNCLKRWFEQKQECPMCRLKIIPNQRHRPPLQQAQQAQAPPAPQQQQQQQPQRIPLANRAEDEEKREQHAGDEDEDSDQDDEFEHKHQAYRVPYAAFYARAPAQDHDEPAAHSQAPHHYQYPSYSYQYPYHAYYGAPHSYPYAHAPAPAAMHDPSMDLQHLTRSTQRQIEYHEMCVNQLKLALEQYISLQSKWKNEDEEEEKKAAENTTESETEK